MLEALKRLLITFFEWATGYRVYVPDETHPGERRARDLAETLEEMGDDAVVHVEIETPYFGHFLSYDYEIKTYKRPKPLDNIEDGPATRTVAVITRL